MPQQNIEIVRQGNAAFNGGDVDAFLKVLAPDAEFQDLANAPDQSRVVKGRAAIQEAWTLWSAAFDEVRADVDAHLDRADVVICGVRWLGHGKGSGMSVDT